MCKSTETLAEVAGLGRVLTCSCGSVHLNLGPVTIRLDAAALTQLAGMTAVAASRQQQRTDTPDAALEALTPSHLLN